MHVNVGCWDREVSAQQLAEQNVQGSEDTRRDKLLCRYMQAS